MTAAAASAATGPSPLAPSVPPAAHASAASHLLLLAGLLETWPMPDGSLMMMSNPAARTRSPYHEPGEENLLMLDEDKFHLENILIHEFGAS